MTALLEKLNTREEKGDETGFVFRKAKRKQHAEVMLRIEM